MLYIFDMGGVVLHGVYELLDVLKEQGLSTDVGALYKDDLIEDLSAGRIDEAAYWKAFNARHGCSVEADRWGKTFHPEPDKEMCAFIDELKDSGKRVICGTNTFHAHYSYSLGRGHFDCFDKVYASHIMGVAKPDPRFWQFILDEEGVSADQAVFIDDFEVNVNAAAGTGIRSFLFRDLPSLREELALPAL